MIKIKHIISALLLLNSFLLFSQVKIGDNPNTINSSSVLELESTSKGFLPTRLTSAQRDAIVAPVEGLVIYNTTMKCLQIHNGISWGYCLGEGPKPSCLAWLNAGATADGIYKIDPDGQGGVDAFDCYCDQTTDGGGWARIEYVNDFAHVNHFNSGDGRRWLPSNFTLTLTDAQINSIRALATQGKQLYHGTCEGVIHYYYTSGTNYNYSFGFRLHDGPYDSPYGVQNYAPVNITVSNDGCKANDGTIRSTDFLIDDIRVPIINVSSLDNGDSNEKFGSTLTTNPAWLR